MAEGECPIRGCGGELRYAETGLTLTDNGGYYQATCSKCGAEMKEWHDMHFAEHEVEATYRELSAEEKLERLVQVAKAAEGALTSFLDRAGGRPGNEGAAILDALRKELK